MSTVPDTQPALAEASTPTWRQIWLAITSAVRLENLPTPVDLALVSSTSSSGGPLCSMRLAEDVEALAWIRYMDPTIEPWDQMDHVYAHCRWMGWTVIVGAKPKPAAS